MMEKRKRITIQTQLNPCQLLLGLFSEQLWTVYTADDHLQYKKSSDMHSQASCSMREEGVLGTLIEWALESTLQYVSSVFTCFGCAR